MGLLLRTYSGDAPPAQTFHFRDGGHAIYFVLDKGLLPEPREFATYMFVIGGSDCTSMKFWLPQYFRGLEGESGPMRIFVLHKRFIEERTWGRLGGCSEEFIRLDHPRRWVSDYTEIIAARLAQGRPKRVVLVGISEGGEVVPLLAHRISGVTHLILLASGGMDPVEAFRLQAAKDGRNESIADMLSAETVRMADSGDLVDRPGGRERRYWTELSELEPTRNLLALEIPILVGMGEDDRSVPIEGAWQLRDRFAARVKGNLTVMTFQGADHSLSDSATGESRLPDFWHRADLWLAQ